MLLTRILPKLKKKFVQVLKEKKTGQNEIRNPAVIEVIKFNDKQYENKYLLELVPTERNSNYIGANWLIRFGGNDFSEHGEDGIISKIFEILKPENKWVCEFGAHDPEIISNTWKLINQQEWNALLIEADDGYFAKLKNYYKNTSRVHCLHTKVSYEGDQRLDCLLEKTPVPEDLDFMVIDIDGNDYHVWEAIQRYKAKVLMIEFNAAIPTDISYVQPAAMSVNQGASLNAMCGLAKRKGYKLIAVTSWNAFFVKESYFHLFFEKEPLLDEMYVYPARHPIWMRAFQLYDGTLMVAPWNEMLWHRIDLKSADYQVLPESFRFFSRELALKPYIIESDGSKTELVKENEVYNQKLSSMPGNVLAQFSKNVFSRDGEDGIIEKLIAMVSSDHHYFVELGAWDGVQNSRTRHLVVNHQWRGLQVESDPLANKKLVENCPDLSRIKIDSHLYNASDESDLDHLFAFHQVPKDFDLLVLNVFGMEYYLWDSIAKYAPKIVAVQFNPTIQNDVKFIQEKNKKIHQGCSLRALLDLAHLKGYELVGATLETAFFVQRKYIFRFTEQLGWKAGDLDSIYSPMQMQLFQLYDGTLVLEGLDRLVWHALRIDQEKLQVVPKSLRRFHQFADGDYKSFFYRI